MTEIGLSLCYWRSPSAAHKSRYCAPARVYAHLPHPLTLAAIRIVNKLTLACIYPVWVIRGANTVVILDVEKLFFNMNDNHEYEIRSFSSIVSSVHEFQCSTNSY